MWKRVIFSSPLGAISGYHGDFWYRLLLFEGVWACGGENGVGGLLTVFINTPVFI